MTKSWLSQAPRFSAAFPPVHLNQVSVRTHLKGEARPFLRCICTFHHIEAFDIPRVGSSKPVDRMSKATKRSSSDRPHGTTLGIVEECYQALGRAVELSGELALGSDVVVVACPKSPGLRSVRFNPRRGLLTPVLVTILLTLPLFSTALSWLNPLIVTSCFTPLMASVNPLDPLLWMSGLSAELTQRWSLKIFQMSLALGFVA